MSSSQYFSHLEEVPIENFLEDSTEEINPSEEIDYYEVIEERKILYSEISSIIGEDSDYVLTE